MAFLFAFLIGTLDFFIPKVLKTFKFSKSKVIEGLVSSLLFMPTNTLLFLVFVYKVHSLGVYLVVMVLTAIAWGLILSERKYSIYSYIGLTLASLGVCLEVLM